VKDRYHPVETRDPSFSGSFQHCGLCEIALVVYIPAMNPGTALGWLNTRTDGDTMVAVGRLVSEARDTPPMGDYLSPGRALGGAG
jgi:hypothetical protein